jgi:hypothetical protein
MFTVANVIGFLQSLLRLFTRRRRNDTGHIKAEVAMTMSGTPGGSKPVGGGFDMKSEIAKLAERILEPVTANLAVQELEAAIGRIRHAFEELNAKPITADTEFASMAVNILEPTRHLLNEAEFARALDRLRGAMVGFCQSDRSQSTASTR